MWCGPSPHAWGEPIQPRPRAGRGRTIPTRVGRTGPRRPPLADRADHPHTRGENIDLSILVDNVNGPSPHAWGEPPLRQATGHAFPDHPHTRGENARYSRRTGPSNGPSPHAWGEPTASPADRSATRTIPTRVGRTPPGAHRGHTDPDHPHTRGENSVATAGLPDTDGPSPHAWGERGAGIPREAGERTIPTRVGRTARASVYMEPSSDHPHTRGENVIS